MSNIEFVIYSAGIMLAAYGGWSFGKTRLFRRIIRGKDY